MTDDLRELLHEPHHLGFAVSGRTGWYDTTAVLVKRDWYDRLMVARAALTPEPALDVERLEKAIQTAYDEHDDHRLRHPGHAGECQDDWPSAWRLAPLIARAYAATPPSEE